MTTEKFLLEFGFESLRDLPDLEALKDAGLMGVGAPAGEGDALLLSADMTANDANGEAEGGGVLRRPRSQEASGDRVA